MTIPMSKDGVVTGRPDEKWTYVVEALKGERWVCVHTTDDVHDAIREAKKHGYTDGGRARVRSFKAAHIHTDHGIDPKVFSSKPVSGDDVKLIEYQCDEHRDERISVPSSAKAPRCPRCNSNMLLPSFIAGLDEARQ